MLGAMVLQHPQLPSLSLTLGDVLDMPVSLYYHLLEMRDDVMPAGG